MRDTKQGTKLWLNTVPSLFEARANHDDVSAVVTPDRSLTYAELLAQSTDAAALLGGLGVRKGTVVALVAPNGEQWITYWLACARLGAVVVPMNTFTRPEEVERTLRHSGAHVLISVPGFMRQRYRDDLETSLGTTLGLGGDVRVTSLPQLRDVLWLDRVDEARDLACPLGADMVRALASDVEPSDPLTIVYTSGSTGDPKGVIHAHGSTVRQAARLAAMVANDRVPVLWTSMPLSWVGGLTWSFLRVVVEGGTFVTQDVFEPGVALNLMQHTGVNVVTAWGPVVERLTSHASYDPEQFAKVEGMGPMPAPGDPAPPSALGMTETLGPHSGWSAREEGPDYPPEASGSLGRVLPGLEHRVVDSDTGQDVPDGTAGELLVRGDSLMLGRSRIERNQTFDADGWYHTGDEVIRREGGWIFLQGRLDDVIKTSGTNVSPSEVSAVLSDHGDVALALVTSVMHPLRGADVVAFIVPEEGRDPDIDEMREHARAHLAAYKVPRRFHLLAPAEIPWTPSQKIDFTRLRQIARDEAVSDSAT